MKHNYELSKLAIEDLSSIWKYTAERWSVNQANVYYNLILEAIEIICINPKIGVSIGSIKKHHRTKIVKSHFIVYKIEQRKIFIDRILHQSMDIDNQVNDE